MSGAISTTVRLDDHLGPAAPEVASPPEPRTRTMPAARLDMSRLHELAEQMRRAVVNATEATDLAAKTKLWDAYRSARTEALALHSSASDNHDTQRLRSL